MAGNILGRVFRLVTFGESHGPVVGGVIEGCPAGLPFDFQLVESMMSRRSPGLSPLVSERVESDKVEWLSGVFDGICTGTPIGFIIPNEDARSADYDNLKDVLRPSHADYGYNSKYGFRDHRGGGRASARETASRVAGGAVAMMLLRTFGVTINAAATAIGPYKVDYPAWIESLEKASGYRAQFADPTQIEAIEQYLLKLKSDGDSTGGMVSCRVRGCPPGLGEPVFDKLNASIAGAMMSLPAAKGIEFGSGFDACSQLGSQQNDAWILDENAKPKTLYNHSGGILGGISTGEDIIFTVGFKPASSIGSKQTTLNTALQPVDIEIGGRHDPCVVPRAVVVVEAMVALVIADMLLIHRLSKI